MGNNSVLNCNNDNTRVSRCRDNSIVISYQQGELGPRGKSAYDIAIETGEIQPSVTEQQWISSLSALIVSNGSDKTFVWEQSISTSIWTIPHNLNKYPSVIVTDDSNNVLTADVSYVDLNIVRVTHGSNMIGKVYCN